MTERYTMAEAAADLERAGLLAAVLVAEEECWRSVPAADAPGSFLDAVLDSRLVTEGVLFVGLQGTKVDGRRFVAEALNRGAQALAGPAQDGGLEPADPSPGRGTLLVSHDPEAALALLAHRWRERQPALILGVTGSNGKTTTKDLLAVMLTAAGPTHATRGNFNSTQGVPVTLLQLRAEHGYGVVEMGASAVGHIAARAATARPVIGVITNAAGAHLEEFGSLDNVIRGKGELVEALPAQGVAILNADSPGFASWRKMASCPVVSWGEHGGDHRWSWEPGPGRPAGWLTLDGERWPVPLPGRHNAANLVAAILAGRAAGVDDPTLRRGLESFKPSPHRGELRLLGGRIVLDDCYNANPASMVTATRMLLDIEGGLSWAVVGAMAELGPTAPELHRETGRDLAELGLDVLVAVGENATTMAEGFEQAGGTAVRCPDHAAAADHLASAAVPGHRILIKGSRSAAMEKVLIDLTERVGWIEE